jgi:hypothetical protein
MSANPLIHLDATRPPPGGGRTFFVATMLFVLCCDHPFCCDDAWRRKCCSKHASCTRRIRAPQKLQAVADSLQAKARF